jgi:hypothetical protein
MDKLVHRDLLNNFARGWLTTFLSKTLSKVKLNFYGNSLAPDYFWTTLHFKEIVDCSCSKLLDQSNSQKKFQALFAAFASCWRNLLTAPNSCVNWCNVIEHKWTMWLLTMSSTFLIGWTALWRIIRSCLLFENRYSIKCLSQKFV